MNFDFRKTVEPNEELEEARWFFFFTETTLSHKRLSEKKTNKRLTGKNS